jgi:hypothetical protein
MTQLDYSEGAGAGARSWPGGNGAGSGIEKPVGASRGGCLGASGVGEPPAESDGGGGGRVTISMVCHPDR